jgi:general secretion pathway protein D
LARFAVAFHVLLLALALSAPQAAWAGSGKAKDLYNKARKAELQKDYDQALLLSEQAMNEDPSDHRYELAVRRLRFIAAQTHVDQGRRLREQGLLKEAVEEFQRAVELDPASTVASQQLRRTLELIEKREGGGKKGEAGGDVTASALEQDRAERQDMVESLKEPPVLKPLSTQHIDLMSLRPSPSSPASTCCLIPTFKTRKSTSRSATPPFPRRSTTSA